MEQWLRPTFREKYLNFDQVKSFPGQQSGEKIEFFMRRHWVTLISLIIGCIVATIVIGSAFYLWLTLFYNSLDLGNDLLILGTLGAALLLTMHIFFIKILNHFLAVTIVTNRRIIDLRCTTLLYRERDSLDLARIQDIKITQAGVFQRLFDYGDITTHNATGQELFVFRYIPRPQKYFNAINHIHHRSLLEAQREGEYV